MNLPWHLYTHPNTILHTCDITIVGATLPSIWLAIELKKKGFSVCILEYRSHIASAQELRQLGVIQLGLLDNFWRISQGMGESAALEIYQASIRGARIIGTLTPVRPGGWMLSKDEREEQELNELYDLYTRWGVDANLLSSQKIQHLFPQGTIHTGLALSAEGCVHPDKLASVLSKQAQEQKIPICSSINIQKIEEHNGGVRIHHQHGTTDSDVIIYMQHDHMNTLEPFFTSTRTSVRIQSIAYKRTSPYIPQACTAQYGYLSWRDEKDIRFLSGCRWATPHLEQGESDDRITVPTIENALIRTAKQLFLESNIHVLKRWSMIEYKGCDGLPIVGDLPGRSHIISCTAFHGRLLGLGFAGAESILALLEHGHTSTLPSTFSPRRFIV